MGPRLTENLADDLDIRTAVLDPVEGLTDETADEDYLSLISREPRGAAGSDGC